MNNTSPNVPAKSHYEVLDGLRGVAAIMVVCFHTCEAYANDNRFQQVINHGYLAVDFFFLLSGFVIAYAYDDRWNRMTTWQFFKRRLIRLQPMVIVGNLIGAALFYFQVCPAFPLVAVTPVWRLLVTMLIGFTMLPLTPALDIRGWDEMHPLDGPAWSLFFEYLANIFYALGIRKLRNRYLGILVAASAVFLCQYLIFGSRGDAIGGWAINATQLHIGFARLLFPFFGGMLLERLGGRFHVRHAFLLCSALLVLLLSLPRFGGPQHLWMNGLYEACCIVLFFPFIVAAGAGDRLTNPMAVKLCRFFGDISYPLYITHYPLIYVYTAWVIRDHVPVRVGAPMGVLLVVTAITVAYASLKLYDEPVRAWLSRRFLARATVTSAPIAA